MGCGSSKGGSGRRNTASFEIGPASKWQEPGLYMDYAKSHDVALKTSHGMLVAILLVSPTTGWGATPFSGAAPEAIATSALHTPAWNSTGFPALSVPMGFDEDQLPLGLQLIGRPMADGLVLAAGHGYQQLTGWHLEVAPNHR